MRNLKLFLIALTMLGALAQVNAHAQTCEKLIVTGPPNSPPSSWLMNGKMVGASVDLVTRVANGAGVKKVETNIDPTWNDALEATYRGETDLIFSAAWSNDRAQYLNYIQPPYASQFLYVVVRKGHTFPLLKYEDLASKKGAAVKGEAYGDSKFGQYVEKNLNLTRANSLDELFDMLLEGKIDFAFGYENTITSKVFSSNLASKVEYISTFPYHAETYFAFSKRSKCYEAIAKAFAAEVVKASREYSYFQLMKKYRIIADESELEKTKGK